jgi:DNA-binding transcriptional MocR family regulator
MASTRNKNSPGDYQGERSINNNTVDYYTNKKYDSSNIITSDQLFMTNGCTSTLHILISKYNESGDTILVDNPTYFIALNIFKEYGLNIEGIDFNSDRISAVKAAES